MIFITGLVPTTGTFVDTDFPGDNCLELSVHTSPWWAGRHAAVPLGRKECLIWE